MNLKAFKMTKKGQILGPISQVPGVVLAVVVIAIFFGVGALILGNFGDQLTAGSTAANVTNDGLTALDDGSDFQGTIITVAIAVVLIALVTAIGFSRR